MRILVVGAGAVGSFLGATLASGGDEVWMLRRGRVHGGAERSVLRVHDASNGAADRLGEVRLIGDPLAIDEPPDAIVIAVKQYSLGDALSSVASWAHAAAVTVQNGIGAEEQAARARGEAPLVAGSLTTSVSLDGDDVERHTGGGLGLAAVRAGRPIVDELARGLNAGGLRTRTYPDAAAMKWSKLLLNLVGNATGALLDVEAARIYASPAMFAVERAQLGEALAVMDALELRPVALPGADARLLAVALSLPAPIARPVLGRAVAGGRGSKMPSLRAHLRAGGTGPSEVAWLNGAVSRAGAEHGVATPVNTALEGLVDRCTRDPELAAWLRLRPDRLLGELRL